MRSSGACTLKAAGTCTPSMMRPGLMRLSQKESDLMLLHGDGVRSWFRIRDGEDTMSSRWERLGAGGRRPWMDMRFDRVDGS